MEVIGRVHHHLRIRRFILFLFLILAEQSILYCREVTGFQWSVGIYRWTPNIQRMKQSMVEFDESAYYFEEGSWNETFIQTQQANVPAIEVVSSLPEPLSTTQHNRYYLLRHGQSTANVDEVISSDRFQLSYSDKHGLTEVGYQQGKESAPLVLDCVAKQISHIQTEKGSHPMRHRLIFISSPFARARQTALACIRGLKEMTDRLDQMKLELDPFLRLNDWLIERYFGNLDNEAIYTYAYVWPLDKFNVTHTAFGVESVAAVATRFHRLIQQLEQSFPDDAQAGEGAAPSAMNHIVLVSHADVLQIAQLYAAAVENIGEFSSFRFKSKLVLCCPSYSCPSLPTANAYFFFIFLDGEVRPMLVGDTSALPKPFPLAQPNRSTRQG